MKEITTTTVTRHFSSFDQYDSWDLSHDSLKSLFIFVLYQDISFDFSDYFITSIYFYLYFCFLLQQTTIRMPQQKSTSFLATKVANCAVVMAEMIAEMGGLRKEVKRLRHHVSVLSKRNHRLVEDGKSRAASPIASNASLSSDDEIWEEEDEKGEEFGIRVEEMSVGEEARGLAHGAGVPAPWWRMGAEELMSECQARERYLGRTKWKVAGLNVVDVEMVDRVVAESVAVVEEAQVSKPVVRMPSVEVVEEGKKRRRVGWMTVDEMEAGLVRGKLIAPLGPRAICGGLLREVGSELVFAGADPGLVAGGDRSNSATVGLSRRADAGRHSPGKGGGYQLRPRVGGYGYRGTGDWVSRRRF